MRFMRLLVIVSAVCMFATLFAGCAVNAPETASFETTTTTTLAPTSTPTPTPEPTSTPTPTPTPVVEEWVTDKDLIGTWAYEAGAGVSIVYTFNEDNTGLLTQTVPVMDLDTKEQSIKQTDTEIKYTVLSPGVIRIVTGETRYVDYEYKFVKGGLQLEDIDHYSRNVYKKK